jgi:transcriptional antiterminator RfaH
VTNSQSGPRWYVAQTQPHAEGRAVGHLERQGFLPFLPRYLKRRRHARRTEIVGVPLFPRYVFVSVDIARQRWHAIRSTIGIVRLIERKDGPVVVTPGIVEGLIARQDEQGFIRLGSPAGLKAGDSVRVLGGAFEQCLGLLEQISDEERVTILLDLLGRKVRVSLDAGMIAAA